MTRRQITAAVAAVALVASLSALVAYRLGLRRSSLTAGAAAASTDCVDFHRASERLGEQACVTGRVLRVYTSRSGNTFLDFCSDYRDCPFTSVIFSSDRSQFGDLSTLGGRQIEVRGKLVPYRGQPEIVVKQPNQIREAP